MTVKELPPQKPLDLTTCDVPVLSLPALALTDKYEWDSTWQYIFTQHINIYMSNANYTLY
jgi:hypothetical protein